MSTSLPVARTHPFQEFVNFVILSFVDLCVFVYFVPFDPSGPYAFRPQCLDLACWRAALVF